MSSVKRSLIGDWSSQRALELVVLVTTWRAALAAAAYGMAEWVRHRPLRRWAPCADPCCVHRGPWMRRWMDRRWRLPEVWCRPLNSVQPMKLPSKTKGLLPHFLLALLLVDLICTFPLRFVLISTGRRSVQLPNGSRAAALSLEYLQFHRCGNGSTTSPVRVSNAVMESCDFQ